MTTLTITQGGPDIDDGTYPMCLMKLEGPKTIVPQSGPNAGQDIDIYDWLFQTSAGVEIPDSTSTASGPRSKMYAWLTALQNGRPPAVGQSFASEELIGRWVLGTIRRNEAGWPKIAQLVALPAEMQQQQFAQATGAPTAAPAAPGPVAPPQVPQAPAPGTFVAPPPVQAPQSAGQPPVVVPAGLVQDDLPF